MFNLEKVREYVTTIGNQISELKSSIEGLKRERETISAACAPRSEIIRLIDGLLARSKTEYLRRLGESLNDRIVRCDTRIPERSTDLAQDLSSNLLALHNHPVNFKPEGFDVEVGLLGLMGDTLRPLLVKAVEELPWPGAEGLPLVERQKELARLDNEIGKLETQLATLEKEAEAAGVRI